MGGGDRFLNNVEQQKCFVQQNTKFFPYLRTCYKKKNLFLSALEQLLYLQVRFFAMAVMGSFCIVLPQYSSKFPLGLNITDYARYFWY
jgi:hypothetical protein